jgi:hypothetical protein
MLPDGPAGVSPAGRNCPVATVVILGGGKGDRPVGSPGVNVSGGPARAWSDPSREASQPTGCSGANQDRLEKKQPHGKRIVGHLGVPSFSLTGDGPCRRRRNWVHAAGGLPGVDEGDMSGRNGQGKHGTTRWPPRRPGRGKATRISRRAVTSRGAGEWGGWGPISEEGAGHHNPSRSEGPWGSAGNRAPGGA